VHLSDAFPKIFNCPEMSIYKGIVEGLWISDDVDGHTEYPSDPQGKLIKIVPARYIPWDQLQRGREQTFIPIP